MPRDVLLAVDTSSSRGILAIRTASGDEVFGYDVNSEHAERALPALDRFMKERGLGPDNLKAVVVNIGPGSFTGVRVGVSMAKALAFALKIPVVSVTSLEVIATRVFRDPSNQALVLATIDARRGEEFAGVFSSTGQQIGELVVHNPTLTDEWATKLSQGRSLIRVEAGATAQAADLLWLGEQKLARQEVANPNTLEPAYVREPDATPMAVATGPIFGYEREHHG